ncbi:protein unc-13 isoform X2 [Salvia divinorum]|uniref:Protein unc-13 isoform X2 n=1 Tax=Salvia divinorum TaxID=28513 RepID=A0ABD1FJZ0_SALDI
MSKHEPHAYSAVEVVSFAKEALENFFDIPIAIIEASFHYLIDGLQAILREYIAFVVSCGTKQAYMPTLPPLTRCSRDSKSHHRPTTSRGTQRLYIRINTLHHLVSQLQSLDKSVSISPKVLPNRSLSSKRKPSSTSSYFEASLSTLRLACQHVSEVAAHRLIFLDSSPVV